MCIHSIEGFHYSSLSYFSFLCPLKSIFELLSCINIDYQNTFGCIGLLLNSECVNIIYNGSFLFGSLKHKPCTNIKTQTKTNFEALKQKSFKPNHFKDFHAQTQIFK